MKSQWILISALIFALLITVFAVFNVEQVKVNYLFGTATTPLILVIVISTVLGGLLVSMAAMFRIYSLQKKVKQLEKQLFGESVKPKKKRTAHNESSGEASSAVYADDRNHGGSKVKDASEIDSGSDGGGGD